MGVILGKLRKKKSTYEVLEKLDSEIKSIEEFRRSTEQAHKKTVGRFILISVLVYLVTAFIFYFYFFPASMYERLIYIIPLISAPLVILSVKRVLTWYYHRKLNRNQDKLAKLREEKKKMLDTVMETETYKVAKNILDKFAPEPVRKPATYNESTPSKALTPAMPLASTQSGLRYRGYNMTSSLPTRQPYGSSLPPGSTPLPSRPMLPPPTSVLMKSQLPSQSMSVRQPAQLQLQASATARPGSPAILPRAILPRERTVLDKMVDYLVGDGPSNRYALICKQCSSHNGMALKEEFEYLSFRCCYCSMFNPARKQRPAAPKLELEMKTPRRIRHSDTSESERNSSTDIDTEDDNRHGQAAMLTGRDSGRDSPDIKLSDIDKLSDLEPKLSDEDCAPMEVDPPCHTHIDTANQQGNENIPQNIGDVHSETVTEEEVKTVPSGFVDTTGGKTQD